MKSLYLLFITFLLLSCNNTGTTTSKNESVISGDLIIFHAGSLSVPFQKIARAFEQENPGIRVLLEPAGSVDCARKITDLHKPCDLMASSDYKVIRKFLIPEYTSWYLPFAGNEMVIAFTEKSKYRDIISQNNWPEILLKDDVYFGRSDQDADPCGYRTVMLMQLAGAYYNDGSLSDKLSSKDLKYIRPKEVDLLSMLELHETDYIFIYRSVAIQHALKYIELPDEINLRNMDMDAHYRQAVVKIKGKTPSNSVEVSGEAISYAITMLNDAPNPEAAGAFLHFMLNEEKGMKILNESGHNSLIPIRWTPELNLPVYLKKYSYTTNDTL